MMIIPEMAAWTGSIGMAIFFLSGSGAPADWETIYTWGGRMILICSFLVGTTWTITRKLTRIEVTLSDSSKFQSTVDDRVAKIASESKKELTEKLLEIERQVNRISLMSSQTNGEMQLKFQILTEEIQRAPCFREVSMGKCPMSAPEQIEQIHEHSA